MRNLFNNRIRQARGLLLLDELLEGNLKRRKKKKPQKEKTRMPSIDDRGIIQAFHPTKRALHEAGLLHATSIIVIVKRDPETGEPALLIVDKADRQVSSEDGLPTAVALDVLGGHVREKISRPSSEKRIPPARIQGSRFRLKPSFGTARGGNSRASWSVPLRTAAPFRFGLKTDIRVNMRKG